METVPLTTEHPEDLSGLAIHVRDRRCKSRGYQIVAEVVFLHAVNVEVIVRIFGRVSGTGKGIIRFVEGVVFRGTPFEEDRVCREIDLLDKTIPYPDRVREPENSRLFDGTDLVDRYKGGTWKGCQTLMEPDRVVVYLRVLW